MIEGKRVVHRRRLDRARHHVAEDREDAARRGRARGPPAHLEPADAVALLLRHRHADAGRADRGAPRSTRSATTCEADSLGYLSLEGLVAKASYCTACWSGDYRVPISAADRRQSLLFPIRAEEES
jgi:hypothetical protein